MKYIFGICGPFDFQEKHTGGQSVKTREFYNALSRDVGKEHILLLESTDYRKNPISFLYRYLKMLSSCEHVVILPAHNGIRCLAPLSLLTRKIRHCKIHYNVIGGWLPELTKRSKLLCKAVNSFDTILVETTVMQQELKNQGIRNAYRLNNFKALKVITTEEIHVPENPIKLCYFSRVIEKKGICEAVRVVNRLNSERPDCCSFDIYGPVSEEFQKQFQILQKTFGSRIQYCGVIQPDNSTQILKNYDLQLFPTKYKTEGIPGAVVDSYASGVPVIASRWNSFGDVIAENEVGLGFQLGNEEDFYRVLSDIVQHPDEIIRMKKQCLKKSCEYAPDIVLQEFYRTIGLKK